MRYRFQNSAKVGEVTVMGWNKRKQKAIKTRQGEEEIQCLSDWCCASFLLPPLLFFLRWQIRFSNSIFTSISSISAVLPLHCGYCAYFVLCVCVWEISAINLLRSEILLQSPQSKKINRSSKHSNLILLLFPGAFRLVRSFLWKLHSLVYTVESFKSTIWCCRPSWKLCITTFSTTVCQGDIAKTMFINNK